jgi:hypothetical protein
VAETPEDETREGLFARIAGSSRRERVITAITALVLLVAVAAFIALPADQQLDSERQTQRDGYTTQAERICLDAKVDLAASGSATVAQPAENAIAAYARDVESATARARRRLASLDPPADRRQAAARVDTRLQVAQSEITRLAELASSRVGLTRLPEQAMRVEAAGARVDRALRALGLTECAKLQVGLTRLTEP